MKMKERAMDTELSRAVDDISLSICELQERHKLELNAARKIAREALIDKRRFHDDAIELRACLNEAIANYRENGGDPDDVWLTWARSLVS